MSEPKPRAYAQGDLDYLCGVYAVVNAIRYAVTPLRQFRGKECRWLFSKLISELARTRALRYSIVEGNSSQDISRLLCAGADALTDRFGISLTYQRPFRAYEKIRLRTLTDRIATHQAEQSSAVLIGFDWHWTVIRKVTRTGFRLLDSAEIKDMRFNQFVIGISERPEPGKYRMSPSWLYLIWANQPRT